MKKLLSDITSRLNDAKVKYEVHDFPSGAVMVDIWIRDKFFVIQIDGDVIGLSEVTEETGLFDIIPDKSYKDAREFIRDFEKIFS